MLNKLMKANEEKLNYLAFFDLLTELPNRKMILNRLKLLIHLSIHQPMPFALVIIDIDDFKRVNDSLGHATGDLLLISVGSKLNNLVHPDDMLGRLGGNEFAVIIQSELKDIELFLYLETFRNAFQEVFTINETQLNISSSSGVSLFPSHGTTSIDLLKCADTALYESKSHGKNKIQFFKRDMEVEVLKNIEFEKRLLSAIENNEMYLVFQPQYTADTKKLRGFETLIRWNSPELGFISPLRLISVAEEIGYIIPLGKWILKNACMIFKDLLSTHKLDLVLSVNISAVQLVDNNFLQMGITIALDDFGTGYSSLSYLQLLPIDILKIDKSFVDRLVDSPTTNHLTGAIISLVHQMGMKVVAEGVETDFQLTYLKENKCDFIQGYIWNKPLDLSDVLLLLAEQ